MEIKIIEISDGNQIEGYTSKYKLLVDNTQLGDFYDMKTLSMVLSAYVTQRTKK